MSDEPTARRVAERDFGLTEVAEVVRLTQGRVNDSFFIRAREGAFVLQRLHPVFGRDGAVVENVVAASARLIQQGFPAPQVVRTAAGAWWAEADGVWRLMTWMPGAGIPKRDVRTGVEAARCLGRFHRALADIDLALKPLPPAEYNRDGPAPPDAWGGLMDRFRNDRRLACVADLLERGTELTNRAGRIDARTWSILHGDPKLENFVFDDRGRARGLIDLDAVRPGHLIWELADGLRSWAASRDESGGAALQRDIFRASAAAYRSYGLPMTDAEWRALPRASAAMTLDLARRYLTDYFEGCYFAWDRDHYPSLTDQNRSRGAAMIQLAEQLIQEGTDPAAGAA